MKAVIYARFSCHNQNEQSIEGQLRDCYEFAKRNNIEIVGQFIDRATSAKTDNRAEFQRMISESEKCLWQAIIVWKLDRFARNRYDSAIYKTKLRKCGVSIMSAMENIANTPEGILVESLLEGMAEYFSADLAEKVNRGMRETALKGNFNGGPVPLGYKIANKKYEIDETTAPFVKKIFEMYADGLPKSEIIKYLKSKGVKSNSGRDFTASSFNGLLKNKRYCGIYTFKDIEIPNAIPRLIEDDLFERVQKRMKTNKRQSGKNKANIEYLLTTKMFCGNCKASMIGESGTSRRGITYRYYKCYNRKNKISECDKKPIRKELIEDIVIDSIIGNVLQDEMIERISDKIIELQKADVLNSIVPALEQNLKDTEKARDNVMKAIEQGIITKTTQARLAELEDEVENLKFQIKKEKCALPVFDKQALIALLNSYKDGDKNDMEYRRRLVNLFVNKIYLYDDKLLITYNCSNEKSETLERLIDLVEDKVTKVTKLSNVSDFKIDGDP